MNPAFEVNILLDFATRLLCKTGLDPSLAVSLAETLLEGDLLGFYTHGLFRLPQNIEWIERGETRKTGAPGVLVDRGAVINWDAGYLPGPSVMMKAVELLCERSKTYGVATITVRKSQHIACLAPYVLHVAEKGLMAWMVVSTPAESLVCPHGGIEPLFSTNPFAAPSSKTPFLFDISFAQSSAGKLKLAYLEGKEMPFSCVQDAEGKPSCNPLDALTGGLLPLGGVDTGYKGYGLLLWSELMTTALGGWGRLDRPQDGDANSVTLQVLDPEAFLPGAQFIPQADFLADLCRGTRAKDEGNPVRVPGDRALELRRKQRREGIQLSPVIMEQLEPVADRYGEPLPLADD